MLPLAHSERSYDQCWDEKNFKGDKPSLGSEVIAGGAAFGAFKEFEDHRRKEGQRSRALSVE